MSTGNLQNFLDAVGQPGVYTSPHDFTAVYGGSATTLTLTGLPVLPTTWIGVLELPAVGVSKWYPIRDKSFSFVPATGVLTVTNASFVNTSTFIVIFAAQHKAHDPVTDSFQTTELGARQLDFIESHTPITAHDLSVSSPADSGWVNVKDQTFLRLFYDWTTGAGAAIHDLLITMVGESTDAGTTEYHEIAGPVGATYNGAATNVFFSELVEVTGYTRVKIYCDESGGTGKGTITLSYTSMNR